MCVSGRGQMERLNPETCSSIEALAINVSTIRLL